MGIRLAANISPLQAVESSPFDARTEMRHRMK
jgi:hypothetical protein